MTDADIAKYGFKWDDCIVIRSASIDGWLFLDVFRNGHYHTISISPKGMKVHTQYHGKTAEKVLESLD